MDVTQLSDEELERLVAQPQVPDFSQISDAELERIASGEFEQQQSQYGMGQTALEGFGKGATFGYLPQLQAMAEPITDRIFSAVTGKDVEAASFNQMIPGTPEYIQARDENLRRQQRQAVQNPKTAALSELGGVVATSFAPGGMIAKGARAGSAGQIARGAAVGAGQGALINPGDVEGEFNPFQTEERLSNAKTGAIFGGVASALGVGVSKTASKMKKGAEGFAFKSSGAMLKDFRQAAPKGEVEKLGRFMLDKGIVKAGDTYEDVAKKSAQVNKEAGQRLDKVYKQAESAFEKTKEGISKRWQEMSPKEFSEWKNLGFNPVRDKRKILTQAKKALGDDTDAKLALNKLEMYLDELTEKYGDKILDPKKANDIKSAIDRAINYARNPLSKEPGTEKAFKAARAFLNRKITNHIDKVGKAIGDKKAAKSLKAANLDYGNSKRIRQIAEDQVNRQSANNWFSLPEYVIGGAGLAGGASVGDAPGGVVGTALAVGATRLGRRYGASTAARALDVASRSGRAAGIPAKAAGPTIRTLLSPGFISNESSIDDDLMLSRRSGGE